jgi:2-hydroxychromene-2-carboxylate isomerase
MRVEFWFDFSCPYAYLASTQIDRRCAGRAALTLHPMLLGGVFRGIGAGDGPMATLSPAKAAHNARDMLRWAERMGVPLRIPPAHPMRTVLALRIFLGLPEATWPAAMHAIYAAYWVRGEDVTSPEVIARTLAGAGLPDAAIAAAVAGADTDAIKDELRRRTDQAIALGVFGAPAMIVHRDDGAAPTLLWGQDRLDWLDEVLAGWDIDAAPPPGPPRRVAVTPGPGREVDFYVDVASPFAYLAATQMEDLAARAGATVRLRPILLGALFRAIGTADVPLFTMPEAKRRYIGLELGRWARYWGVPFRFPRKFPQRTITAQRLLCAADDAHAWPLLHRLFRGFWHEDLDLEDDTVLARLIAEAGAPADLLARAGALPAKDALRANTDAAIAAGVFGVPTAVAHDPAGPLLYWGQDRLDLLADALAGKRPAAE